MKKVSHKGLGDGGGGGEQFHMKSNKKRLYVCTKLSQESKFNHEILELDQLFVSVFYNIFFFNYLLALKAGLHFMVFFVDKVTIYNILGLLFGTYCDIFW